MKGPRVISIVVILLISVLTVACQIFGQPVSPPVPTLEITRIVLTVTPVPEEAITPTLPPTHAPTETSQQPVEPTPLPPTSTSAPTLEPPSIPSAPLSSNGPWLLIPADNGLYAINPDGSGLTHLTEEKNINLQKSISPRGDRYAFVTLMMPDELVGLELFFDSPRGDAGHVASLSPDTNPMDMESGQDRFEAYRAIYDYSPPVFSPDGSRLAFMGMQDGVSSDLYVYNFDDGSIDRLTDGPSHGYQPSWSPDGKWIFHTGAETFGTGAGYVMAGVWAAAADGSRVRTLYPIQNSSAEQLLGWAPPATGIIYSWSPDCGPKNLRLVDMETGEIEVLWAGSFMDYNLAFDPSSATVLINVAEGDFCFPEQEAGAYLIHTDGRPPQRLGELGRRVAWDASAGLFLISGDSLQAYTANGEEVSVAASLLTIPVAAPTGPLWVWAGSFEEKGVYVGRLDEQPRQIFSGGAFSPTWSPDGSALFFFTSDSLYAAFAPDFVPVLVTDQVSIREEPVWMNPQDKRPPEAACRSPQEPGFSKSQAAS